MGLLPNEDRERIPALTTGDKVPLHPALTDVPVATFSLAPVFDAISLVTGSESAGTAGLWTAATGVLWSLPTAAAGVLDYLRAPSDSPVKRIGIAHAALNSFVVTMTLASLVTRRFGKRPTPLSLVFSAAAGAGVTYSSHLGGVMVHREGAGVTASRQESRVTAETSQPADGGPTRETQTEPVRLAFDPEIAARHSRLGEVAGNAATIGGDAEDSPDIGACGLVAQAEACPAGRIRTGVASGADNPDDFARIEGGDRPGRGRRRRTRAA